MVTPDTERTLWNQSRTRPLDRRGSYESYFQRANHPSRPLAFWIRYTALCPAGRPQDAVGELWAIYFDGEAGRVTAAKQSFPLADCHFSPLQLDVRVGPAELRDGWLEGAATRGEHELAWLLRYTGDDPPLLLLPRSMYQGSFPRAKALVGTPNAAYTGRLMVDGEEILVDGWIGSQNHNWGSQHTDRYAWGQVAGFDAAPGAFFECSTARVRLGPVWTPWLTLMVLRLDGKEFALNSLLQSLRSHGRYRFFTWELESRSPEVRIRARIEAPATAFVGLRYDNPPGGHKTCLNTKLGRCELNVLECGRPARTLRAEHRAAFEILTDETDHGVPVLA